MGACQEAWAAGGCSEERAPAPGGSCLGSTALACLPVPLQVKGKVKSQEMMVPLNPVLALPITLEEIISIPRTLILCYSPFTLLWFTTRTGSSTYLQLSAFSLPASSDFPHPTHSLSKPCT